MIPLKRRKVSLPVHQQNDSCKFPHVSIFILERKMGTSRRAFLTRLGRSKGFLIKETYSSSITHIVSENNSGDEVQAWLDNQTGRDASSSVHLLDIRWFTESMEAGHPVIVQDRHILKVNPKPNGDPTAMLMKSYACQRRTPLKHHNSLLTEALEILAQNAEYNDNEGRSVAFRRAASVLKALPRRVRSMEDLRCLPCLGDHSQRVIKEILEDGSSREVESTRQSEQYQAMKALIGIFGVGVRTADRWFREGLRSPDDLIRTGQQLNREQQAEEGKEEGLMPKITNWLEEQGLLLYQKTTRNSYLEKMDGPARTSSNMDRFERCFSIFKLQKSAVSCKSNSSASAEDVSTGRESERPGEHHSEASGWRAVRVDLVVSPYSQFAFATLGWTGSKLFERELRRWAGQEKHMTLSSHTLYDSKQNLYLRAKTEEEIFAYLGLEFIPPSERNA
ncbi:hypothetical protein G5714_011304 [Onychostoma macrolepis]|uniref:DNA-directed DNA/RNA polymerase mu n=1 Tax=Onychostoma macrolepis TaxID=369639 RepID=A0A7J6CPL5_9TELE|nr:hypothetical protein G5714_011304 [Onychostoma macrolepis]